MAKLTTRAALGWAVGQLGSASYVGVTVIFLLFYLTEALGINPAVAGVALLLPRLWDVVAGPIMGVVSDRTRSRLGRRRPYVGIGSVLLGLTFALMFYLPSAVEPAMRVFVFTALYFVVSTVYAMFEVPYSAMAAELSEDYKERTTIAGYKMVCARLGIVAAVFFAPFLFGSTGDLESGFSLMGVAFGAFMAATGLVAFFATARAPRVDTTPPAFSFRGEFSALSGNKPFRALLATFFVQNLAIGMTASSIVFFLVAAMGATPAMAGTLAAVSSLTAAFFTPLWVKIAHKLGKPKTYTLAILLAALTTFPPFFVPAGMLAAIFVINFVHGIADAGTQLLPNSMVPDTVEVDEMQTGRRCEGIIFGAWSCCRKLGMALGAFAVSLGLGLVGYVPGSDVGQDPDTVTGIRILFAVVPTFLWLLAAFLAQRYRINEAQFLSLKDAIGASSGPRRTATPEGA